MSRQHQEIWRDTLSILDDAAARNDRLGFIAGVIGFLDQITQLDPTTLTPEISVFHHVKLDELPIAASEVVLADELRSLRAIDTTKQAIAKAIELIWMLLTAPAKAPCSLCSHWNLRETITSVSGKQSQTCVFCGQTVVNDGTALLPGERGVPRTR